MDKFPTLGLNAAGNETTPKNSVSWVGIFLALMTIVGGIVGFYSFLVQ